MPDIFHTFPINVSPQRVFDTVSTPKQIDQWWTQLSSGKPDRGQVYSLEFGPAYQWKAVVSKSIPGEVFEFTIKDSDPDWFDTRVGFAFSGDEHSTLVSFYHTGWPKLNEHYRISCYCWAMYLRILKRYIEFGETCEYSKRLEV